jgi:hypothetical protein
MKPTRTLGGSLVLFAALTGGTPALAATSSPAGLNGIALFVTSTGDGRGRVVVAGAIGDFGTTAAVGHELKVALQHGSFELNVTQLIAKEDRSQPTLDKATCSGLSSSTAPAQAGSGTGSYQGIVGTLSVTQTIAFLLPSYDTRAHFGCDNNAAPLDDYSSITASGQIHFR